MLLREGLVLFGAALSMLAAACVVETDHHDRPYGGGSGGGGGTNDDGAGNLTPMLVEVDPDQVMAISPGDGVGVFVEYGSGGHWHVRWTADTNASRVARGFDLKLSVSSGAFTNFAAEGFSSADQLQAFGTTPNQLEALTRTSAGIDGLHFDTTPGAVVTIDAAVDGMHELPGVDTFLFFVQAGQVNGGFQGKLTNPLMFQGKSP